MTVEPELQPRPQTQAADSSRAHASAEPHSYRRPVRLLLWGAGSAHLRFLKSLQKKKLPHAHITLLTQHAQVFQTRKLAPFVANGLAFEDCLTDLEVLLQTADVHWTGRQGRAMDADSRTVLLDDGTVLDYDVLSVNIGPQPRREAIEEAMPGARAHGLFVPPLEGFVGLWPKVCELGRQRALRIAVIGDGLEGFELALAVRQRMPTAAVTWIAWPHANQRAYPEAMHQHMLAILRTQRVTVLYEPVASLTRDDVVLANGARLACDVPLLRLSHATSAWVQNSGLDMQPSHEIGNAPGVLTDLYERSTSHPEVFFVQQDSRTLARNLHAVMQAEPQRLRPKTPPTSHWVYAGPGQALAHWHGYCAQGRWVGSLQRFFGA